MLRDVIENRNVPLTWTNQTSTQTSTSNTLTIISPPAPVSEMERSRAVLITVMCVLISSISGIVVEMRVKPGDDVTIYCDCTQQRGFNIVWLIQPSQEHQPPLINVTKDSTLPRYSRVWNNSNRTYDLLVKSITESDLGLYYCTLHKIKVSRNKHGEILKEHVYHDGNRTTFLSYQVISDTTLPCANLSQTTSTPPVSDCSVCWKLLVSVCPACVLLSSVVSSTCVFCICQHKTKADRRADQRGNINKRNHNQVGDDDVCYASLDVPSGGKKRLKKRTAESSDLCTYSEVKAQKM